MKKPVLCAYFRNGVTGRLAQLVEQRIYTAKVGGSSPSSPTHVGNRFGGFLRVWAMSTAPTCCAWGLEQRSYVFAIQNAKTSELRPAFL